MLRNKVQHWWSELPPIWQRIILVASIVLVITVVIQVAYPADRTLPFAQLNGDTVGMKSKADVEKKLLADYSKINVTTTIRDKKATVRLPQTGITIDNDTVLRGLTDYPWYLRIVPFSALVKGALVDQPVRTTIDPERYTEYSSERLRECELEPKNAGVVVKDGEVVLDPAKDGQFCSKDSLKQQLLAVPLDKGGVALTIKTTAKKPARSDSDVAGLLKEAKTVAERKIVVTVAGKSYAVDKPTLAGWLAFPEDPATKKLTVGVNDEAVAQYLGSIQKDVYIAPGTTVITTHDGIETGRVTGANGRGIDSAKTTAAIKAQVLKESGTVEATLAALPPKLAYNRSYSKTPEGLQALVNDIVKDKGEFAISVRKLGDGGVHVNGGKQYHPASTYKLPVAYSVLKRIDSGQFSWGQASSSGQTISQCLDNMIVNSDNACAEWFGGTIGWNTLTAEARALGMSNTTLSRPFVSTANDMALFLQKLESNQLGISEPSRARLLDAMKRQVYRKGIPAGVGVPVADKVGFLDGLLHDAAIVYSPSGVYVLVIYSNGSSWGAIADAARQIHAQLQ